MISSNIDGTSGSNQVLDLLSLLAGSPDVYKNKLKELQDATAEHKKYVDAVGPASEIVRMRTEIADDAKASKDALNQAKAEAQGIVDEAKAKADAIIGNANSEAADITAEAKLLKAAASSAMAAAQAAQANADTAQSKADSATAVAQAKSKDLDKAITEATIAKDAAEKAKADIIAKHKAFIESL